MYHPVVVLKDDSNPTEITSKWASWRQPWPIGATISILIDPSDKNQFEVNCFSNIYGIPATLFGLSAITGITFCCTTYFN